jgi:N-acetylglucosamine-6-phosphate deacetylase
MKITATHCISGRTIELDVKQEKVTGIRSLQTSGHRRHLYVGSGLTDLQVNGFRGIDFNSLPLTVGDIGEISRALLKEGVTKFFPTVITNTREKITSLLKTIQRARQQNPVLQQHIPGIHLEGPFISPADGARGAHDADHVVAPDWALFEKFQKAAGGLIRIITLSPEWKNSSAFIKRCVQHDVLVSIGHTIATPEQIREAVRSGARMSTHLGNGAPLLLPRHPNFIWEQLASDELAACLIADGFHTPPSFIKTVLRAKGSRALLVSDCTMFAGMKPGTYTTYIGGKVRLDAGGRLSMEANRQTLAGAAMSLIAGVDFLINEKLATLKQAWSMASIRPNRIAGVRNYGITDAHADLVIFERENEKINVMKVFKAGVQVYTR